jgi:hypothetical protein
MRTSRLALLLATGALTVAVSGCGPAATKNSDSAKEFTGDKAEIAKVVDDLEAAAQKRDGKKVCNELLAPALVKTFKDPKRPCKTVMNENLTDADLFKMKVDSVVVTGDTATAVVSSDAGKGKPKQKNTFAFTKDAAANGVWKVSSFG